jgi:hypothetical protein
MLFRCLDLNDKCNCSFNEEPTSDASMYLLRSDDDTNAFYLLKFRLFNNSFKITYPVGHCSNNQVPWDNGMVPNPDYYKYCACCGEYNPDSSMGCPKSQLPVKRKCNFLTFKFVGF